MNTLLIAPDIASDCTFDRGLHLDFGSIQTCFDIYLVGFGSESTQVAVVIGT